MRKTSANCSVPTTRCCRTTSTCPSVITVAHRLSVRPALTCAVRRARPCRPVRPNRRLVRVHAWTTNWNWVSGSARATTWATPSPLDAADHIAGFCLLNDWSARDIQAWEYQPLGPFLSKSFITSISPWVVTAEALQPFRRAQPARPEGDPQPLPYLFDKRDQAGGAFDIELEVLLLTETMREQNLPAHRLTLSNTKHMYWTGAQMVAHHSVNGCQLQAGDLFGSGTLSGPENGQFGSLL